jgi:hypothetical protein
VGEDGLGRLTMQSQVVGPPPCQTRDLYVSLGPARPRALTTRPRTPALTSPGGEQMMFTWSTVI